MPDTEMLLYIASELAILLLLVTVFLLLHVRKLKGLIAKLEEKVQSLRKSLSTAKKEAKQALEKLAENEKNKPKVYADYLDEYIEDTRKHHKDLNPDRDIVLDISPDAPLERQAASLRHALLIAEKEADSASEEDDKPDWGVLQAKLQQIIQFYQQASEGAGGDEEEALKKRIENLERFKKLFFEMESKWEKAKEQADDYYEQLMALGIQMGGGEQFQALMDQYASSFDGVGQLIIDGGGSSEPGKQAVIEIDNRTQSVGKMVIANEEEVQRLRNMAVDQHRVITELKKQLVGTSFSDEQQQVIDQLAHQLEQQQRFVQEAETCSQLLEDELTRALEENQQLRDAGAGDTGASGGEGAPSAEEVEKLGSLVDELTDQSTEMLNTIASLEEENNQLRSELSAASTGGGGGGSAELQEKLDSVQQELLNLQTQHIELEERYLELKMK